MKLVVTHTDFRLYWPARLEAFRHDIEPIGWSLHVIEIAGKGSPYSFAAGNDTESDDWWTCLFPDDEMESIPAVLASRRLYQALNRENPDVVVAGAIAFPSGATAVRWAREKGRRVVIFDDARLRDVRRMGLVNWIKGRIYANVDAMLVPAPSHLQDFLSFGLVRESVFFGVDVVNNAYFSNLSAAARKDRESIRQALNLPCKFLLGVGRQVSKKNWCGLLDSWSIFCQEHPDSELGLVLVGNGMERERMEAMVEDVRIPRVEFRDFLDPDTLVKYYALACGLVLPSFFGESWGLVVNEAMAAGLAVLVSRECGCCEALVEEDVNGWSFDPRNQRELAERIHRLDSLSQAERISMGEASCSRISEWGLERFLSGLHDAVQFAARRPMKFANPIDRLILRLWKGRYRPS